MTADIDFQIESYQWLCQMRGRRFMRQARQSIDHIGLEKTADQIIRPNMSEEMEEAYRSAFDYMAVLAPRWVLNNGDVEVHQGA